MEEVLLSEIFEIALAFILLAITAAGPTFFAFSHLLNQVFKRTIFLDK